MSSEYPHSLNQPGPTLFASKSNATMTFSQPRPMMFAPKPDMTAYELAMLMPVFFGQPMTPEFVAMVGPAMRHFEEVQPPSPILQRPVQAPVIAGAMPRGVVE